MFTLSNRTKKVVHHNICNFPIIRVDFQPNPIWITISRFFMRIYTSKTREKLKRRLPDDVKTCRNYAYLQEIYDAVRATDIETKSINNQFFLQDDALKDETVEYEANFVCTTSQEGKIELHLTTESEPVAYLLVGSLKSIARLLYDTQTDIRLTSYTNDPRRFK
ncbi:hypothetical protein HF086_010932 [Spodoptera exigua]|uniref:Uncharacterized protein n=1 Tax=Spodoptera exigua TaxID=7107 RepID=A0A922MJB2_SPOEX|nr:hypothetical protein HF086_010932 [Spodoptera exigua]